jgi:hypothetical protein
VSTEEILELVCWAYQQVLNRTVPDVENLKIKFSDILKERKP